MSNLWAARFKHGLEKALVAVAWAQKTGNDPVKEIRRWLPPSSAQAAEKEAT